MASVFKSLFAGVALALVITAPLQARPALGEVSDVTEKLITAGMAYEISRQCGPVELRMLRGVIFMNGIQATAMARGYSKAEIDAFVGSDAEKSRLEAIARQRLAQKGAVSGNEQSYCMLADAEISARSELGGLLKR